MTDLNQHANQTKDMLNLEEKDIKKLPSMLNVLTILTYIGCALGAIMAIWGYFSAAIAYKSYAAYQNLGDDGLNGGNKALVSMMQGATEMVKKQYDNRLAIMLLALTGVALCFYGAMQMRNLKKQGYMIYVVGEILPIISFAVFIGFGNLLGAISMVFVAIFAALFIILYTTQRNALIN